MKPSELSALIQSPLFKGVDEDRAKLLLSDKRIGVLSAAKGEKIYTHTNFRRALGIIIKGRVRVEKENGGRTVIMSTLEKGGTFGMAALFYEEITFPTSLTALSDCVIAFFPKELLTDYFRTEPSTAENYITLISAKVHFLNKKIETLASKDSDGKLWRFLTDEYKKNGKNNTLTLQYNMADLSKVLGIGRTSLYRELDALTSDNRIKRQGKIITFLQMEELS